MASLQDRIIESMIKDLENLKDFEQGKLLRKECSLLLKRIESAKKLFLDEENIAIVNPIKTAIKNFENIENIDDVYQNLIKYEREAKIAKNEFDQVYENTDDDVLKKLASDKAKSTLELDEIEHWLKNIYNKPYNPQDPPNTESIRTLDKKISDYLKSD